MKHLSYCHTNCQNSKINNIKNLTYMPCSIALSRKATKKGYTLKLNTHQHLRGGSWGSDQRKTNKFIVGGLPFLPYCESWGHSGQRSLSRLFFSLSVPWSYMVSTSEWVCVRSGVWFGCNRYTLRNSEKSSGGTRVNICVISFLCSDMSSVKQQRVKKCNYVK